MRLRCKGSTLGLWEGFFFFVIIPFYYSHDVNLTVL